MGETETKARANGLDLPLGLLALDGSKFSDEEIMKAILDDIQKKNKYAAEAQDNFTSQSHPMLAFVKTAA